MAGLCSGVKPARRTTSAARSYRVGEAIIRAGGRRGTIAVREKSRAGAWSPEVARSSRPGAVHRSLGRDTPPGGGHRRRELSCTPSLHNLLWLRYPSQAHVLSSVRANVPVSLGLAPCAHATRERRACMQSRAAQHAARRARARAAAHARHRPWRGATTPSLFSTGFSSERGAVLDISGGNGP